MEQKLIKTIYAAGVPVGFGEFSITDTLPVVNLPVITPAMVGAAAASHTHSYQAADADLLAIGGLVGSAGLLRKTAVDTWILDTTAYMPRAGSAGQAFSVGALTATDALIKANASVYLTVERTSAGTEGFLYAGCTSSSNQIISQGAASAAKDLTITIGGTERGRFSSTGLAVTGGISATGNDLYCINKNLNTGSNASPVYSGYEFQAYDGSHRASIESGDRSQSVATGELKFRLGNGRTLAATLDTTGLAVTGTLSTSVGLRIAGSSDVNMYTQMNNTAAGGRDWLLMSTATGGYAPGSMVIRDNTGAANVAIFSTAGLAVTGATNSSLGFVSGGSSVNKLYGVTLLNGTPDTTALVNAYDMTLVYVDDTHVKVKLKGSDSITRSVTLTLA